MNFEDIQQKIEGFLQKYRQEAYTWKDEGYKLKASDAIFCAEDRVRNRAFFEAIGECIRDLQEQGVSSIRTVDAGSGTGILGLFALEAGTTHCTFLEHNPKSLEINKALIQEFGYTKASTFLQCDATSIQLEDTYELLMSETLTSGFLREDFIQIIKNLLPYSTTQKIIPEAFSIQCFSQNSLMAHYVCTAKNADKMEEILLLEQTLLKKESSLSIQTNTVLYKNTCLTSGSCVSFMNPLCIQK